MIVKGEKSKDKIVRINDLGYIDALKKLRDKKMDIE